LPQLVCSCGVPTQVIDGVRISNHPRMSAVFSLT
jgi:hypothetical protein